MKKLITLLFAVLASTTLWAWGWEENSYINGIKYYVPKGKTNAIVSANSYSGDIYIPTNVTIKGEYNSYYNNYDQVYCTVSAIGTAFANCPNLTSVSISNTITKITDGAFDGSGKLTAIIVDEQNSVFSSEDGILYNKSKSTLVKIPEGKQGVYTIPSTVTALGTSALKGCNMTVKVDPKNPAFCIKDGIVYNKDCTKILYFPVNRKGEYTIPNTITAIDNNAFSGCAGLTTITIPSSVTSIGSGAFSGCTGLTSITLPNSITTINDYTFSGCSALTSIDIPNSVTSIGIYAFNGCNKLSSIKLSNSLKEIGGFAFIDCVGLTSINLPNSLSSIGNDAFRASGLTSITIPNSVTILGNQAFYNCTNLKSITLSNGIKIISTNLFSGCTNLTSIIIPNGVTTIKDYTFSRCINLTSVVIPPSVTTIFEKAFPNPCHEQLVVYTASSEKLPKTVKKVVRISPDKLKYYEPFSSFAKKYVEQEINEWQKKGEFERTNEWKERVNEQSRQQKVAELLADAEHDYNAFNAKRNKVDMQLGKYDADNEVFSVTDQKFGVAYLAVPYEEAPMFKENWKSRKISYQLRIIDDKLKLAYLSVLMPNGKEYTYRNTDAVNYNLTEAEYDFDPIDLNSAISAAQDSKNAKEVRKAKSAVDTNIPEAGNSNPNTFVVIFANEDYKNVASVPFAKNDGAIFQKYCQRTLGIPVTNIHYVENASFNDIRIQLAWMSDVCNAFEGNASLIIYYAGHGIPDETDKSAYLLPVDGDGRYVQSAYKLDEMYQKLGAMNAKSVTVFMDACFSGSKREEGMIASARGVAIKTKSGQPQGKMVVFSAASGDETAYPNTDEQHGMFTYYLLKKLQETKGDVTLQDLGNYITTNVRQQSIVKNGKPQNPCVTPSSVVANSWQNWKLK